MVAQPVSAEPPVARLRPVERPGAPVVPAFNAPLKALVGLARAAELALPRGKALIPAVANLRVTVAGGRLALAATDLEVFVEATLPTLGAEEGDALLAPSFAAYLERLAASAQAEEVAAFPSDKGALATLAPGNYKLIVEAAREVGGRELLKVPFQWPAKSPQAAKAQGEHELGAITVNLKP